MAKKEKNKKEIKPKMSKTKKMDKQVIFFLIMLVAILASFFAFSYLLKKPCYDYEGFKVCRVVLEGTNVMFYSIPVTFKVSGYEQQNNVVLRTDPKEIAKLNIPLDVSDFFFKTRPTALWVAMNPQMNAKAIEAAYEITKFTDNIGISSSMAFTENIGNSSNAKIIKCEEATNAQRVILLKYANITEEGKSVSVSSISTSSENPSCIIIESTSYEGLLKAADSLVLEWLLRITEKK